jgi:5'-nucleotidase
MATILITNDDGIASQGITELYKALQSLGVVFIVAPENEQSAVGRSLTLHRPLRPRLVEQGVYSINGTPTDCVAIGLKKLLPTKPDLVVSGINKGANLGDDIAYSGTVSAAMEGTLLGVASIAFSSMPDDSLNFHFARASRIATHICAFVLEHGLPQDTLLNVNFPNTDHLKGFKLTKQGKRVYDNAIQEMNDPWGRKHYWIGGGVPRWESEKDTDFDAVLEGYVSLTPIHLNVTNFLALDYLTAHWRLDSIPMG